MIINSVLTLSSSSPSSSHLLMVLYIECDVIRSGPTNHRSRSS